MIVEMEVDPHRAETSWGIHRYLRVRVSFSLSLRLCVCVCVCEGMGRPAQIRYLGSHMWLMDDTRGISRARKCSRHREGRFEDGSYDDRWTQNSTEANGMSICVWLRLRLRMWLEPTAFSTPPSSLSLLLLFVS
jgi:hypothetical protein